MQTYMLGLHKNNNKYDILRNILLVNKIILRSKPKYPGTKDDNICYSICLEYPPVDCQTPCLTVASVNETISIAYATHDKHTFVYLCTAYHVKYYARIC